MNSVLPNFKHLNKEDGKIYGRHNVVTTVNPFYCRFIATYPDGKIIKGNDLINTGWDDIPHGLIKLEYVLSTGVFINIPKYRAYKPLIDVSVGMEGSRVFHSIKVQCLDDNSIVINKIILKEDQISKYKIGDVIVSRIQGIPEQFDNAWKFAG